MKDVYDDHERESRLLIEDVNVLESTAGLSRMRLRPSTVVAFKVPHVATRPLNSPLNHGLVHK